MNKFNSKKKEKNTSDSEEKDDYFKYQMHLCKEWDRLKEYKSKFDFLKEQNQKTRDDFFFNNLFLFYHSTFDLNNKYRDYILHRWKNLNLYHYTDYKTLEAILSFNSLKFNCIRNMNDWAEGSALIENLDSLFKEDPSTDFFFHKNTEKHTSNIFAFCFTTLKDDASQWERYGTTKKNKSENKPSDVESPKDGESENKPSDVESPKDGESENKPSDVESPKDGESEDNPCGVCITVSMKKLKELTNQIYDVN